MNEIEDHDAFKVFLSALLKGDLEKCKVMLPNIDPSENKNAAIKSLTTHKERSVIPNHLELVWLLLKDPRVHYVYVLLWACGLAYQDIVQFCLDDPRIILDIGLTMSSVSIASERGHLEIVKCLMNDGRVLHVIDNIPSFYKTVLTDVIQLRQWDLIKFWMNHPKLKISQYHMPYFIYGFIDEGRGPPLDFVKFILDDSRIDLSFDNNFILNTAAACRLKDLANLLLCDRRVVETGQFNGCVMQIIDDNHGILSAVTFCCNEIGNGWADLMFTITERTGLPLQCV